MVLNGTAAYSVVSHQGKGKANVGGVPAVNFQKGYDIFFREGGAEDGLTHTMTRLISHLNERCKESLT
jgi:hypothetical protein